MRRFMQGTTTLPALGGKLKFCVFRGKCADKFILTRYLKLVNLELLSKSASYAHFYSILIAA